MTQTDDDGLLDSEADRLARSEAHWRYAGFTGGPICGLKAEFLPTEERLLRSVPGLELSWLINADLPTTQQWALRCPLTPGHDGPHGTPLGKRPWPSPELLRDLDDQGNGESLRWYLLWGSRITDPRELGPYPSCTFERFAFEELNDERVEGVLTCTLWLNHRGDCRLAFVGVEEYDTEESPGDDCGDEEIVELAAWRETWKAESMDRARSLYLSGDAAKQNLLDGWILDDEEFRNMLDGFTREERTVARRKRHEKMKRYRQALRALREREAARLTAAADQ